MILRYFRRNTAVARCVATVTIEAVSAKKERQRTFIMVHEFGMITSQLMQIFSRNILFFYKNEKVD